MTALDVILNEVKNLSRSRRAGSGKPVRWVAAPQSSLAGALTVHGVALAPGENVQWSWTHTASGSYVSGYSIVRSLPKKRQNRVGEKRARKPFASIRVTTVGGVRK